MPEQPGPTALATLAGLFLRLGGHGELPDQHPGLVVHVRTAFFIQLHFDLATWAERVLVAKLQLHGHALRVPHGDVPAYRHRHEQRHDELHEQQAA